MPKQAPMIMTARCCGNCEGFRITAEGYTRDGKGACETLQRHPTVHHTNCCSAHKLGLPPEEQFKEAHGFVKEPPMCFTCKHGGRHPSSDDYEADSNGPCVEDTTECHHPDLKIKRMEVCVCSVCGHYERG